MKYSRTSALNNVNVHDLFCSIASDIINSLDEEKINLRSESIKLGYLNSSYFNKNSALDNGDNNNHQTQGNNSNNNQTYFPGSPMCCRI